MRRLFLCQRKISVICCLFLSVLFSLFWRTSTSALSISTKSQSRFNTTSKIGTSVDWGNSTDLTLSSSGYNNSSVYGSTIFSQQFETSAIVLDTPISEGPESNQPANLFKFSITWTFAGSSLNKPYRYTIYPVQDLNNTVRQNVQFLDYSCRDEELHGISDQYSLICDYTMFASGSFNKIRIQFPIFASNDSGTPVTVVITASNYTRFQINFDSLSSNDKDWLSGDFAGAIGEAVKNAQEEANEEVKTETQTQVNSSGSTSNTQGSQAQTEGMSLLSVFSNFVSVLTTATPTDTCNIALDFSGYTSDFNVVVDLCSLDFPQELQFIGTLVIIMFVVPLTVATVKRIVNLFKSFTG